MAAVSFFFCWYSASFRCRQKLENPCHMLAWQVIHFPWLSIRARGRGFSAVAMSMIFDYFHRKHKKNKIKRTYWLFNLLLTNCINTFCTATWNLNENLAFSLSINPLPSTTKLHVYVSYGKRDSANAEGRMQGGKKKEESVT